MFHMCHTVIDGFENKCDVYEFLFFLFWQFGGKLI